MDESLKKKLLPAPRTSKSQWLYGLMIVIGGIGAFSAYVRAWIQEGLPRGTAAWCRQTALMAFGLWCVYLGVRMYRGRGHYRHYVFSPAFYYAVGTLTMAWTALLALLLRSAEITNGTAFLGLYFFCAIACFVLGWRRARTGISG